MQPALAEVVQKEMRPGSAATTGACLAARMSLPGWPPSARASPKSSEYETRPTTGKTIVCGGAAARERCACALAGALTQTTASVKRMVRAVGRCGGIEVGGAKGRRLADVLAGNAVATRDVSEFGAAQRSSR